MQNMYNEIKRLFTSTSVTLIRKQSFLRIKNNEYVDLNIFPFFFTEVLFTPSGKRKEDSHTRRQQ